MPDRSFSDLSVRQRREWNMASLAIGLQSVLDEGARISANFGNASHEGSSDLRLSVSHPEVGEPDDADEIIVVGCHE